MTQLDLRRDTRYDVQLGCRVFSPLPSFSELVGVTLNMSRSGLLAVFGEAGVVRRGPLGGHPGSDCGGTARLRRQVGPLHRVPGAGRPGQRSGGSQAGRVRAPALPVPARWSRRIRPILASDVPRDGCSTSRSWYTLRDCRGGRPSAGGHSLRLDISQRSPAGQECTGRRCKAATAPQL